MPSIETFHRHQTVVYWAKEGVNDYGEPLLDTPVELTVRWERDRNQTIDEQGNTVRLDAQVVLDQSVTVGGLVWLGELDDWYDTGSGGHDSELMEIVEYRETPDIKGRNTRRVAGLRRWKHSLPAA